jgi:hypothetical protein
MTVPNVPTVPDVPIMKKLFSKQQILAKHSIS